MARNRDHTLARRLIRCLFPKTDVSEKVIVQYVSSLSALEPRYVFLAFFKYFFLGFNVSNSFCFVSLYPNIRSGAALALKWLVLVSRLLTPNATRTLRRLRGVIFHFVQYEGARVYACRLLFMMTRRADVDKFACVRLRRAIDQAIQAGQDTNALFVLAELYSQYVPAFRTELCGHGLRNHGKGKRSEQSFFTSPDFTWHQAILEVQERQHHEISGRNEPNQTLFDPQIEMQRAAGNDEFKHRQKMRRISRSKRQIVPSVSTSDFQGLSTSSSGQGNSKYITLDEISGIVDLGHALLERVCIFPDRCCAVLQDTMFQHLFCLEPKNDRLLRLRLTIPYLLESEFFVERPNTNAQAELLRSIAEFCEFMQESVPEVEMFLAQYLCTWNGVRHVDAIFSLISRLQPKAYDQLYESYLKPLNTLFVCGSVQFKSKYVRCLLRLVQNWTKVDWKTHFETQDEAWDRFVIAPVPGGVDYYRVIWEIISHVDRVVTLGLVSEDNHPSLQIAAADFFYFVARLNTRSNQMPFVCPLSSTFVNYLLLSRNAVGPVQLAKLLSEFKNSYVRLKKQLQSQNATPSVSHFAAFAKLEEYNSHVNDFCNCVWRNDPISRAKSTKKSQSTLFHSNSRVLAQKLDQNTLDFGFALTHSLSFVSLHFVFVEMDFLLIVFFLFFFV